MKKSSKVRISLDCSAEERNLIKALASLENMTISDYILGSVKNKIAEFSTWHAQSKKENENKKSDTDDFWKTLETIA